jgi:predicted acyl esterase
MKKKKLSDFVKQMKLTMFAVSVACLMLMLSCITPVSAVAYVYSTDAVTFTSADGTQLAGTVFIPQATSAGQTFPAIIFINSWAFEEEEYTVQAAMFASQGYIVLSYDARGWYSSTGLIDVAKPADVQDLSAAVDWLQANTPVDMKNIGAAGISYGAGISLLGLAGEPRIKTAASMSGWGSLTRAQYEQQTPSLVWSAILVALSNIGRPDPTILQGFNDLILEQNIPAVVAAMEISSPINYVGNINARKAPVYFSNNWDDDLFKPNSILDMFSQLTGPKHLDLLAGIHMSAEISGLLGLPGLPWDNVHSWFDYWLKGINNGFMSQPAVTMAVKHTSNTTTFASWPSSTVATKTFYLGPRAFNLSGQGTLNNSANLVSFTDAILSGLDTLATSGQVPVLSQLLEPVVPITVFTPAISVINGIVYQSSALSSGIKLRGIPKLNIWITPSLAQAELVVYLYDVDSTGTGTLITHGPVSLHSATPGKTIQLAMELTATAWDVPAGHRLAIAIDTYDPLYSVPTLNLYTVKFPLSSGKQSVLTVQYVN